ncbi:hypothetical protein RRG08_033775 [Elysia crispata]|uniref:Uncharacterized protein n=1 Tax=Elysia crispata TaxID=231223 RepID=A0AAE1ASF2_9GAST|nr:hypothetical protein RRG08_033775 [Elysia crispata]
MNLKFIHWRQVSNLQLSLRAFLKQSFAFDDHLHTMCGDKKEPKFLFLCLHLTEEQSITRQSFRRGWFDAPDKDMDELMWED